jgi:hypothetical protein
MSVKTEDLSCPAQLVDNVLIITIDSIQRLKTFQCSVPARISVSNTTSVLYETDFENGIDDWTISSIVDTATWRINTDSSVSGNQSIFIPDRDVQSDQSISRSFTITGFAATLAFNHYYNTESTWDGGVVEIFSLGQWIDAGPYFIQNTYNSVIQNNPQSALSGRKAFTGKSDGFIKSRIDLKSFKGQTISIRFRYSSDGAVGGEGWYIDDVLIEDIVVIENFLHARFESKKAVSSWVTFLTGDGIPVAVSELPSYQEILIYPNPASASITIESDLNEELEVQVFDNTGKLIVREYFKGSGSIASEDLSQGIYYVQVRTSTGILRKKIIIQH